MYFDDIIINIRVYKSHFQTVTVLDSTDSAKINVKGKTKFYGWRSNAKIQHHCTAG